MPTPARVLTAFFLLAAGARADAVEFSGSYAERAARIVKRPTIHATTSWEAVDADPKLFEWFLDHPAAAGALWKDLGLEVGSVEVLADGWRSRDPDGVVLEFHRLHRSAGMRGFYCKASVPTRAFPREVTAEFVLVHQVHIPDGESGGQQPIDRMETWVSAEGAALRLVMRVANGALKNAVIRSLRETKLYFTSIARIASGRPTWAANAVVKHPSFLTGDDVQQFGEHLMRIADSRAARSSTRGAVAQQPQSSYR